MVSIDDFNVSGEVLGIFSEKMITDPVDVITTLELYRFVDRDKIIKVLDKKENGEDNDDKKAFRNVSSIHRDGKLKEIEETFNVLFDVVDDHVTVIGMAYSEIDTIKMELMMTYKDLSDIVYVTPINFYELKDTKVEYDPEILFKRYMLECINRKGTDIHFTVGHNGKDPFYYVMYRRNGYLCRMDLFDVDGKLMSDMIQRAIEKKSGHDSIDLMNSTGVVTLIPNLFGDGSVEVRVAANKVKDGFECVCRVQTKETVNFTIEQLGFSDVIQEALHKVTKKRSGITLITGPIRTGKNTTAFALAHELTKYPIKIKSYESPIEALMPFPQVDYLDNTDYLEKSVRIAKKQDINVAILNEIPTKEVAFAVKDLVSSSVHVITTLHIDRIWHLPFKLFEYYGDSYKDIISNLNAVFNQKMFARMCNKCTKDFLSADIEDKKKADFLVSRGIHTIKIPAGCNECTDSETGLVGDVIGSNQPYVEFLVFDDKLKDKLLSCKEPYQMAKVMKDEVFSLGQDLETVLAKAIQNAEIQISALDSIL